MVSRPEVGILVGTEERNILSIFTDFATIDRIQRDDGNLPLTQNSMLVLFLEPLSILFHRRKLDYLASYYN